LSSSFTGYQKKFANEIHLVESGLVNWEGNYQGGGDSPDLVSVGSEYVLGDYDNTNSGNKKTTVAENHEVKRRENI
jgi:hypothetical protein